VTEKEGQKGSESLYHIPLPIELQQRGQEVAPLPRLLRDEFMTLSESVLDELSEAPCVDTDVLALEERQQRIVVWDAIELDHLLVALQHLVNHFLDLSYFEILSGSS
jgi:hypothetical protein